MHTVYLSPNTRLSTPEYTWAKAEHTQDKHTQLSSFIELTELGCYPIKSLADASPPEYVDTHSLPTGYPRP